MTYSEANKRLIITGTNKREKGKNVINLPLLINNRNYLRASLVHFMSGQKFKLIKFLLRQKIYSFEYKICLIYNYYLFILEKFFQNILKVIIRIIK